MAISRVLCILLGRHTLSAVLVRLADGSVRSCPCCVTCGATY